MAPRYRVTLTVEERRNAMGELKALTRAATKTTGKRFLYAEAGRSSPAARSGCPFVVRPRASRKGRDGPWPGWPRRWASRPARSST